MGKRGDYRDVTEPNLRIRDVLVTISERYPQGFSASDLATHFQIELHNACHRIDRLRKYGCIRTIVTTRPKRYEITDWGRKTAKRWQEEKMNRMASEQADNLPNESRSEI